MIREGYCETHLTMIIRKKRQIREHVCTTQSGGADLMKKFSGWRIGIRPAESPTIVNPDRGYTTGEDQSIIVRRKDQTLHYRCKDPQI